MRIPTRRIGWIVGLTALGVFGSAAAAQGAGTTPMSISTLGWMDLKDSHGIPVMNFEMLHDDGGAVDYGKKSWAMLLQVMWVPYIVTVSTPIWLVSFVCKGDWLPVLDQPLQLMSVGMNKMLAQLGVAPFLMSLVGLVAAVALSRGKYVKGMWRLVSLGVVLALGAGLLANPLQHVAAKDGWIQQSLQAGQDAAVVVQNNGTKVDPNAPKATQVNFLTDALIRQPAEMINFGEVIDGTKCEKTYDDALKANKKAEDIRKAVKGCDKKYEGPLDHPGPHQFTDLLVAMLAGPALAVVLGVFAGLILLSAVEMIAAAFKVTLFTTIGIAPGAPRKSLGMAASELLCGVLMITGGTVILQLGVIMIQAILNAKGSWAITERFFICDLLIIAVAVVLIRYRRKRRKMAEAMAELANRGIGADGVAGPSSLAENFAPSLKRRAGARNAESSTGPGSESSAAAPSAPGSKAAAKTSTTATATDKPSTADGARTVFSSDRRPVSAQQRVRAGRMTRAMSKLTQTKAWAAASKGAGAIPGVGTAVSGVMRGATVATKATQRKQQVSRGNTAAAKSGASVAKPGARQGAATRQRAVQQSRRRAETLQRLDNRRPAAQSRGARISTSGSRTVTSSTAKRPVSRAAATTTAKPNQTAQTNSTAARARRSSAARPVSARAARPSARRSGGQR